MYKEPFATMGQNRRMSKEIRAKMESVAAKVEMADHGDADFTKDLLDLCTLNRMAESHCRTDFTQPK